MPYDCSISHEEMIYKRGVSMAQEPASNLSSFNILQRPYQDVEQLFAMREQLGRGTSGVVRRCVEKRTGDVYACKTIDKASLRHKEDVTAVRAEIEAMQVVGSHPAIVTFEGAFEDNQHVHLIMEFCEGGELYDCISERKQYPENEAAEICLTLTSALAYCHQRGIMHRDLKPENIFLAARENHTDIYLGDFGQATRFTSEKKLTQTVGSAFYIAPEVLGHCYGPEADFWSLGVVLYILLAGVPPFWGRDTEVTLRRIKRGTYNIETGPWKQISDEAKDVVSRLLTKDPLERITAKEVMAHPWIVEHCYSTATIPVAMPVEDIPSPASPQFPRPSPSLSPACQTRSSASSRSSTVSGTQRPLLPLAIPWRSPDAQWTSHSRNSSSCTDSGSGTHSSSQPSPDTSPRSVLPEGPKTGEPKSAARKLPGSDLQRSWQQHFGVASQPRGGEVVSSDGSAKGRKRALRCKTSDSSPREPSAGFAALANGSPGQGKAHPSVTLVSSRVKSGSGFVHFQENPRASTHVLIPVSEQFSQLLAKNQSEAVITIHLSASPASQVSAMEATTIFQAPGSCKALPRLGSHLGEVDLTVQKFQRTKRSSEGRELLACFGMSHKGANAKMAAV